MQLKPFEIIIKIKIYKNKLNINHEDKYINFIEEHNCRFQIMDIACVCAIDKAKKFLQKIYPNLYIEYISIEASEEYITDMSYIFEEDWIVEE